MDAADAILLWGEELRVGTDRRVDLKGWGDDQTEEQPVGPPPLKKGERLEVAPATPPPRLAMGLLASTVTVLNEVLDEVRRCQD